MWGGGIPVVNCEQLGKLINDNGYRALIILCVGVNQGTVKSIYCDLVKLNIEADVYDYFENTYVFCDTHFIIGNKKFMLYKHSYNCGYIDGRMTERSVELALAREYLKECRNSVVEVGAVTPYYFEDEKIQDVIDPTDKHNRVSVRKSLFEYSFFGKNVLSISTVEHVGLNDYGMREKYSAIDAIEKILVESESCLITAPLGYNETLDNWVEKNRKNKNVRVLKRKINNQWEALPTGYFEKILYGPLWACGLVIIFK